MATIRRSLAQQELFYLAMLLCIFQVMDGLMTGFGVNLYGSHIEGNILLKSLMIQFGYIPTLAISKLVAILLICFLAVSARHISWMKNAMGAMCGMYLFLAILPWTFILSSSLA